MKKRLTALLLAIVLLVFPVQAAENSMDNFVRGQNGRVYTDQFSDLTADSVFYDNVAALYEYGLSVGKLDGTFGLKDHLTVSQVIIFAGRIRSIYRTGDPEAGPAAYATGAEQPTCMPYLAYLQAEQVIGTELDQVLFTAATRAQMAHVLANVLPREAIPTINSTVVDEGYATRTFIPDVTEYTPYQQDILYLYRCGISQGSDQYGSFLPDEPITRGAAAAMLTRIADPSLRITIQWELWRAHSVEGTSYGDLVPAGTARSAPTTEAEMQDAVNYMLSQEQNVLALNYNSMTDTRAKELMNWASQAVRNHIEQGYNNVSCQYYPSGSIQFTFSAIGQGDTIPSSFREDTLAAAIAVHDRLWANGDITEDMSEYAKAQVYYDWICANCQYDYSADETSPSHHPYRLFAEGIAVCDGYTGAYNLLLKLEGIQCGVVYNTSHIWTSATLDGKQVHIDTTWGDGGSYANYTYFAMTPALSNLLHRETA